uniref:Uncharacterized protein n=1 Tax=Heterorhabditis bacteriophora TaxID=37862 RepID=A0A1I7X6P0_HETBA
MLGLRCFSEQVLQQVVQRTSFVIGVMSRHRVEMNPLAFSYNLFINTCKHNQEAKL